MSRKVRGIDQLNNEACVTFIRADVVFRWKLRARETARTVTSRVCAARIYISVITRPAVYRDFESYGFTRFENESPTHTRAAVKLFRIRTHELGGDSAVACNNFSFYGCARS